MVDLGKFSVKAMANEGVEFYFVDEYGVVVEAGETLPVKFIVYGMDAKVMSKAKADYNAVMENTKVKQYKKDEALAKFIVACVKSWDSFQVGDIAVEDGDKEALMGFFDECPMFREQLVEFVGARDNFLVK